MFVVTPPPEVDWAVVEDDPPVEVWDVVVLVVVVGFVVFVAGLGTTVVWITAEFTFYAKEADESASKIKFFFIILFYYCYRLIAYEIFDFLNEFIFSYFFIYY